MRDAEADAALDESVIAELQAFNGDADPTLIGRLVALFLEEARGHLDALRAAAAAGDTVMLARAAHQLHGSAGFVGAVGIKALSAKIERSAEQASVQDLDRRLGRLGRAIDVLAPRLHAMAAAAHGEAAPIAPTT